MDFFKINLSLYILFAVSDVELVLWYMCYIILAVYWEENVLCMWAGLEMPYIYTIHKSHLPLNNV